jgi:enoyl-CoA hydratase
MMIKIEKKGNVAVIIINRIEKLNALDKKSFREIKKSIVELEKDKKIRVVILSGGGNTFVAGGDIKEMSKLKDANSWVKLGRDIVIAIIKSSKIYIAAVTGYAVGGGCEIATACDIVYCDKNAKFSQPEVKLGIIPGFGGSVLLPRLVGRKAKELIFRGHLINADEALRIGLVNSIIENPLKYSLKIGHEISLNSFYAVSSAKKFINSGKGFKEEGKLFVSCFNRKDAKEGIRAFLEKRKPIFG